MRIRKKLIIIFGVLASLALAFHLYQYEIFVWSCEQEDIASSCMLAGKIMEQKGALVSAKRHYIESCRMDYGIGCFYLANLYLSQGNIEEAEKYYDRACKLDYANGCKNQEK